MPFAAYLREGMRHPPRVAARKAAALLWRLAKARRVRHRALRERTFRSEIPRGDLRRRIRLGAVPFSAHQEAALILDHRFDLLGSGRVQVRHGMACPGLEGIRYPPGAEVIADPAGNWLAARVSPANLAESRRIRALIEPPYTPIDWQLDFKSGYRWSELGYYRDICYGDRAGADVKLPWELARLQHLPLLALAYRAAPRPDYVREFRNQILDFIATNPPRFGVNWVCAMDVAIRIANILIALDLFRDAGAPLEIPFIDLVKRSAAEHASHIAENLEWSESGRGNHYLSDLVGLMFVGAYLPRAPETDAWLAFAAGEFVTETAAQFHPDGGNVEGSTSYHRLSGELLLFGAAVLIGMDTDELPLPHPPLELLHRAARFTRDATKPTGDIVQWGDNDSGRLFKLSLPDDALDHRGFVAGAAALTGDRDLANWAGPAVEASVALALAKGRVVPAATPPNPRPFDDPAPLELQPGPGGRIIRLPVPRAALGGLRAVAYPDFGHYAIIGETFFLAIRCPNSDGGRGPGHAHDDALAVELQVDGCNVITDPGTFVYTPIPAERNRYRQAQAHFVPRLLGSRSADLSAGPFEIGGLPASRCLAFGPTGFVGEVRGPGWAIKRSVTVGEDEVVVVDQAMAGSLAALPGLPTLPPVCRGYGVKTGGPARTF